MCSLSGPSFVASLLFGRSFPAAVIAMTASSGVRGGEALIALKAFPSQPALAPIMTVGVGIPHICSRQHARREPLRLGQLQQKKPWFHLRSTCIYATVM